MEQDKLIADVHEIKNTLTRFGLRLELVYNALQGNELSKDGGLVAEIIEQKNTIKDLGKRVEKVEQQEGQRRLYVNIIWAALAAIGTMIISHFFNK